VPRVKVDATAAKNPKRNLKFPKLTRLKLSLPRFFSFKNWSLPKFRLPKWQKLKLDIIPELEPNPVLVKPRWTNFLTAGFVGLISLIFVLLIAQLFLARTISRMPGGNNTNSAQFDSLAKCEPNQLAKLSEALDVKINRQWYLIGKEFIGRDPLDGELKVDTTLLGCAPRDLKIVYKITGTELAAEQKTTSKDNYKISLDISSLGVGSYELGLDVYKADSTEANFTKKMPFYISKPVYVAWTLDWDGYNFSDNYLTQINQLTDRAQRVPITHFFNPIYSISGGTLQRRGKYFADWIKGRQGQYGDEVGLHIHMFYAIAEAAGVTPRTEPTWNTRGTGSDVPLSSYTLEEQRKIIAWSKKALENQGFTSQVSFRAGGWFANLDTLKALEELGFKIESSGRTAYGLGNNLSGPWKLDAGAQPYFPCRNNQNAACNGSSAFSIMELPNNGGESYRFSTKQLIDRFRINFDGKPQSSHRAINFLSHPEWFNIDYPKMTSLFETIDQHLYANDKGPVLYATVENTYQAIISNR